MATTEQVLTVAARRRALCALADDYNAEQDRNARPVTEALPAILSALCAAHLSPLQIVETFTEFARERNVGSGAWSSYTQQDEAEQRAERLLDVLVGEAL